MVTNGQREQSSDAPAVLIAFGASAVRLEAVQATALLGVVVGALAIGLATARLLVGR
jgi:hypothetical protein